MKTKSITKLLALMAAGTMSVNYMQAQTNTTYGGTVQGAATATVTAAPTGLRNTGFGANAFNTGTNPSGDENSAVGYKTMFNITSGSANCGLGAYTLHNNSTGASNTAVGYSALYTNTANYNNAFGQNALYNNNTGASNVAMGYGSLFTNSSGSNNTAIGIEAGYSNTASDNVFQGYKAGYTNSSGTSNTVLGFESGYYNQTGSYNTITGYQAGGKGAAAANSFSNNSFFGYQAGYKQKTTNSNVAIGYQALYEQNYSGSAITTGNVAIGYKALYTNNPTSGSNGNYNTAVGYATMQSNTTGYWNTAVGEAALISNTTGAANVAVGLSALNNNGTGNYNTAVGLNALFTSTVSSSNSGLGYAVLYNTTTGTENSGLGYQAGYNISSGSSNTMIGHQSGLTLTTGSNNTMLGKGADVTSNALTYACAIGSGAVALGGSRIQLGAANTEVYSTYGSWTSSDGRFKFNITENVKGLEFIKRLRPVTYQTDSKALDDFSIKNMPDSIKIRHQEGMDFTTSTAKVRSGFIAQEVKQAGIDAAFTSSIVHTPDNDNDAYALSYAEMVVPLVKAVQELSHKVDSLLAESSGQRVINNGGDSDADQEIMNNGDNVASGKKQQDVKLTLPDGATLGEPQPNPNNGNTQIPYYLPQNISGAKIIFIDMLGKVMEQRQLESGYGLLNIDTQDLPAGIYSYSLMIDGKVIENKKMIRNK